MWTSLTGSLCCLCALVWCCGGRGSPGRGELQGLLARLRELLLGEEELLSLLLLEEEEALETTYTGERQPKSSLTTVSSSSSLPLSHG